MDKETLFWLNRIGAKLFHLFISGYDFSDEHRWVYDWDENLTSQVNLDNVISQDKALITFTNAGAIDSYDDLNTYREYQLNDPGVPYSFRPKWGDTANPDTALLEFHKVRFIRVFHYEKFVQFCNGHRINYQSDSTTATLRIVHQKPIVSADGVEYRFKSLTNGSTLDIIELIQNNSHYNRPTTFDDLRKWLNKPSAYSEQKYFSQIFRTGNIFHKDNTLGCFADIEPLQIILKNVTELTPAQLSMIRKNSI